MNLSDSHINDIIFFSYITNQYTTEADSAKLDNNFTVIIFNGGKEAGSNFFMCHKDNLNDIAKL